MRKLFYVDEFFPKSTYNLFSSMAPDLSYRDTNSAKRSFCTDDIKTWSPFLHDTFVDNAEEVFGIEILDATIYFYKRNNTIYNAHTDGCKLNLLVYLQGEIEDLDNGTFFLNKEKTALRSSNIPNSAYLFDGNIKHGSVQALYNDGEKTGWRYSLNCFIWSYNKTGWI